MNDSPNYRPEMSSLPTGKKHLLLFLVLPLLLSAARVHSQLVADTLVFYPQADTYVRSTGSDADLNFSNDSIIKARYSTSSAYHEMGLLKFDLTGYAGLSSLLIDSVRLETTLVYEQVTGAYATVLGIDDAADSWDPAAVTWNSGRPDTTGTIATVSVPRISSQAPSAQGMKIRFDITSRFEDERLNGNQILSLGLFTKKNSGANTYFLSTESALPAARPKLVVYGHRKAVSSGIRNLNVVYFVPSGSDTVPFYKQRLNGILYQAQNFYRKWMQYWGYGNRTFGLRSDSLGRVRIVIIHGAHEKQYYPYNGGGSKARTEIEAYFASHPQDKQSTHTLVLMPPNIDSSGHEDVPFYGIGGGWCFALDNPDIDTNYTGSSNYIGGMIHELGHGLNLPHVRQKVSELSNPAMGTSLMGSGNYTYRKNPTFLTKSSCAILNNCEVFAVSQPPADLYQETSASLVRLHGSYNNGNITVSGRYNSTKPVNHIVVYNDPDGGSNYDRESWVADPIGTDSFSVVMPISELHKKEGAYRLVVGLLCANGATKEFGFDYYFENNEPVIAIEVDNYIDTTGTKVYLSPVDDTYGIYADKTTAHGSDSLIQVRYSLSGSQTYNKIGYLKFDLDELHLPPGAVIKNILLQARLQYHQVSSAYKINVLSVKDSEDGWQESTLTWNNRPDTLATVASQANQPVGTRISWVVTDLAQAELDTGNHILSLAVYTELNSAANTWFYSKESAHEADHPRLMVVYTLPGEEENIETLAVGRLKLSAAKNNRQILLRWSALTDDKDEVFLVQRSTDAKSFITIGKLNGAASTQGRLPFSFLYNEATDGTCYYRIEEVGLNATPTARHTYSNVTAVHLQPGMAADVFRVYPNPLPAGGRLTIAYNNQTPADQLMLQIADARGRPVLFKTFAVTRGEHTMTLDLSAARAPLPPGLYFISMWYNKYQDNHKSVKLLIQ